MYHTSISQSSSRRRRSRPSGGKPARGSGLSRKERARLTQLGICLAVFLTLFLGKGIFPDKLAEVHRRLEEVLVADTDFREAFSALGEALSSEDSILGQVGDFCVEVFGGSGSGQAQLAAVEQNLSAYILIYGEPSLLAVLIALVLPGLLGLSGVWIAEPVTQASLALAGGLLLARSAGRSAGNRESQIQ